MGDTKFSHPLDNSQMVNLQVYSVSMKTLHKQNFSTIYHHHKQNESLQNIGALFPIQNLHKLC